MIYFILYIPIKKGDSSFDLYWNCVDFYCGCLMRSAISVSLSIITDIELSVTACVALGNRISRTLVWVNGFAEIPLLALVISS